MKNEKYEILKKKNYENNYNWKNQQNINYENPKSKLSKLKKLKSENVFSKINHGRSFEKDDLRIQKRILSKQHDKEVSHSAEKYKGHKRNLNYKLRAVRLGYKKLHNDKAQNDGEPAAIDDEDDDDDDGDNGDDDDDDEDDDENDEDDDDDDDKEAEEGGGNQGVMDILAALDWVQKNIRGFGGDPGRVSVVGHGSGASMLAAFVDSSSIRGRCGGR